MTNNSQENESFLIMKCFFSLLVCIGKCVCIGNPHTVFLGGGGSYHLCVTFSAIRYNIMNDMDTVSLLGSRDRIDISTAHPRMNTDTFIEYTSSFARIFCIYQVVGA